MKARFGFVFGSISMMTLIQRSDVSRAICKLNYCRSISVFMTVKMMLTYCINKCQATWKRLCEIITVIARIDKKSWLKQLVPRVATLLQLTFFSVQVIMSENYPMSSLVFLQYFFCPGVVHEIFEHYAIMLNEIMHTIFSKVAQTSIMKSYSTKSKKKKICYSPDFSVWQYNRSNIAEFFWIPMNQMIVPHLRHPCI